MKCVGMKADINMKTDSYFEIGSSHEVCQDYALSRALSDSLSCAVISDGCTMSHKECGQVDFGARILSHVAVDCASRLFGNSVVENIDINNNKSNLLGTWSAVESKNIGRQLHLHPLFLDCTLLVAWADNSGKARVFIYGDGYAFVQFKDGRQLAIDVTYLSGAPYYLSYGTDPHRNGLYMDQYGDSPVLVQKYWLVEGEIVNSQLDQVLPSAKDFYEHTSFVFDDVDFVSVMSDGAGSYLKDGCTDIPAVEMVYDFNNLKNRNGVFIERRMKAVAKRYQRENITHYDDISIASVMVEEGGEFK